MAHLKNSYLRLGNNLRILKLFVTHCPYSVANLVSEILDLVSPKDFGMT